MKWRSEQHRDDAIRFLSRIPKRVLHLFESDGESVLWRIFALDPSFVWEVWRCRDSREPTTMQIVDYLARHVTDIDCLRRSR